MLPVHVSGSIDQVNQIDNTITESELIKGVSQAGWKFNVDKGNQKADLQFSLDEIKWPIHLRNWEFGDHFQPFGMNGTQKISDHLTKELHYSGC